ITTSPAASPVRLQRASQACPTRASRLSRIEGRAERVREPSALPALVAQLLDLTLLRRNALVQALLAAVQLHELLAECGVHFFQSLRKRRFSRRGCDGLHLRIDRNG